jgi:hypothetical protein
VDEDGEMGGEEGEVRDEGIGGERGIGDDVGEFGGYGGMRGDGGIRGERGVGEN